MGIEIEKKFLVKNNSWRSLASGTKYLQGYLNSTKEHTVRVRTIRDRGYLTIKGISKGAVRLEYEYEIPVEEARAILEKLCEKPLIEKKRHKIKYKGFIWEVDEFFGDNQGLIIAEVELKSEDQKFIRPGWVGEEVTRDSRYYNANLIHFPFRKWRD